MSDHAAHFEGLVLCHAQGHRLAVPAREVEGFELATPGTRYAGTGFEPSAQMPEDARALRCGDWVLAVDRVEVHGHTVPALVVPPSLQRAFHGALIAFAECEGHLWPVISMLRLNAGGAAPEVSS